ncbi:MAG: sodium-dependent transporter [Candidatus Neomarinimicrobiota bacterium]
MEKREHWGNSLGFILAASGSAVGLGNIWKFPYITGENGGAAFIIIYLICILIIGLPVLIAEILLGRKAQKGPVSALRSLAQKNKTLWVVIGSVFFLTGFIILSYYNVIAGWSIGYVVEALQGNLGTFSNAAEASQFNATLISNPSWVILWQFAFIALGAFIVYFGVRKGIERIAKFLMPIFFIILILLVIWGLSLDGSEKGLSFLFKPDWSTVRFGTVLMALGHAFFTLSVGMGVILTYGSYLNKKDNIFFSGIMIALLDTFIALLAGLAIFTAVFAMGFDPAGGPGLVFNVLPAVFSQMPGGSIFASLFFLLLSIAALTSTISILEMLVSTLMDEFKMNRHTVVILLSISIFILGIPSALSFGELEGVRIFGLSLFDSMDYLSANILMPLGGLFIALFVGWNLKREEVMGELFSGFRDGSGNRKLANSWYFLLKYIAPILIILVFLSSIGIIQ